MSREYIRMNRKYIFCNNCGYKRNPDTESICPECNGTTWVIEYTPEEPQSCPCCNDHPAFDEIAEDRFECRNCGAIIDSNGTVYEEGDEPLPDTEDDIWDGVEFDSSEGKW